MAEYGSMAGQQQLEEGGYDPYDFIEMSEPQAITTKHWNCVPIHCTLADEDARESSSNAGGHSFANATTARFKANSPLTGGGGRGLASYQCNYIVPRQSYMFLHFETILDAFKDVVIAEGTPWMSYRTMRGTVLPIPWQYPVTVVIDMIRMRLVEEGQSLAASVFPLALTVHFSEPPQPPSTAEEGSKEVQLFNEYKKVLKIHDMRAGLLYHRQVLKRSLMYAYDTAMPLLQLEADTPASFTDFFEGIQENDPVKYWRGKCAMTYFGELVQEELIAEATAGLSNGGGAGASVATLGGTTTTALGQASASVNGGGATGEQQQQGGGGDVAATAEERFKGQQLRSTVLPIVIHSHGTHKIVKWRLNGQKLGQFLKEHVPWLEHITRDDIFHRSDPPDFILIQGLSPLLSSPLEDLHELLSCTDMFLHIIVKPIFIQ